MSDGQTELISAAQASRAAETAPPSGQLREVLPGQWYWVRDTKNVIRWIEKPARPDPNEGEAGFEVDDEVGPIEDDEDEEPVREVVSVEYTWLGCVHHVGSNFVWLKGRNENCNSQETRIHFNEFDARCRPEFQPQEYIDQKIDECRAGVRGKLAEIRSIMERLGVVPVKAIENQNRSSTELSVLSTGVADVANYKLALVAAKDKELPKLFEEIKGFNQDLAAWMVMQTLPVLAMCQGMEKTVETIKDRIFSVELYAGLTENVVQVRDGQPAGMVDKLHIMQGRLYMDEECIAAYRTGGIDCQTVEDFDRWLIQPENFQRILPFPRTMVAFRVRCVAREREWDGSIAGLFVNMRLKEADKWTYMYIRNGDQLFRMDTQIEFGSDLFPDKREFDMSEAAWSKMDGWKVSEIISQGELEGRQAALARRKAEYEENQKKHKEWCKEHRNDEDFSSFHSPFNSNHWYERSEDYEPFNPSSVFFDDMTEVVEKDIRAYNRICLVVQGLFDRSPVLHPHPPARLWSADGFADAITLIYDHDRTLHFGTPPDFETYREQCNASLCAGSVTIGQDRFWALAEGDKERERVRNHPRSRYSDYDRITTHRPYGNPGPGLLAKVESVRGGKAKFVWYRSRERRPSWRNRHAANELETTISVPIDNLFNISAYKPGDFRQFYEDPRTRSKYLKWAPILLAAEEYHAGNLTLGAGRRVYEKPEPEDEPVEVFEMPDLVAPDDEGDVEDE